MSFVKRSEENVNNFTKTTNEKGETSLHLAAKIKKSQLHFENEDISIVTQLMENGSDIFIETKDVS